MLGHGALLRTQSVIAAGGFPAFVSEDLALTILMTETAQTGCTVPGAVAGEEFPPSYRAYWQRKRRGIRADAEVVRVLGRRLLSGRVRRVARLDLAIRELRLPIAAVQWLLLSSIAVAGIHRGPDSASLPAGLWALLPCFLVPALPALGIGRLTAAERCRFIAARTFVGAATSALHPIALVLGLLGRQRFDPTGAGPLEGTGKRWLWTLWELGSAALFVVGGVLGDNRCLAAVGLAVGCSPIMRSRLENSGLLLGASGFWVLVLTQIWADVDQGSTSAEHLLALVGLLVT